MVDSLSRLLQEIGACRCCVEAPEGAPLPHEPRPVLRVSPTARLAVCGQAPGTRVHRSGVPFSDPSGDRLRQWMGVSVEEFYDVSRVAIVPMGFCFPGQDASGSDLPPRRECAPRWRDRVFAELPNIELILLVGGYAQRWHLGAGASVSETVRAWRTHCGGGRRPRLVPLPHPSWRNNAWIKRNPWFEKELLPLLRAEVRRILDGA
ncbi:MAG TPA: uracil-DNA glycosylase family protein [Hyphomicrobiaceae bacterium]|nr:uracil-DNA glycosylase family protein [Hyphomicrobiaceae bacterium]